MATSVQQALKRLESDESRKRIAARVESRDAGDLEAGDSLLPSLREVQESLNEVKRERGEDLVQIVPPDLSVRGA